MNRYAPFALTALFAAFFVSSAAAQTNSSLTLTPWTHKEIGETLDRIFYEAQADVKGSKDTTQLFLWDSVARFRLARDTEADPQIGYHTLSINTDSHSPGLPDTLDEISLAMSLHIGDYAGGKLAAIFGAGYSGDNLFADSEGIFAVAHLVWQKELNSTDSLVLSVDYDGSSSFLPDVPLPGFAWSRKTDDLTFSFGYPRSGVSWKFAPDWLLLANYEVPFTADLSVRYHINDSLAAFVGYSNFFNGFYLDGNSRTDRFFLHMQRAEVGIQYINPSVNVFGFNVYVDASLTLGYAFDQSWSEGFDVRDIDPIAGTESTPYVGVVLRGRI